MKSDLHIVSLSSALKQFNVSKKIKELPNTKQTKYLIVGHNLERFTIPAKTTTLTKLTNFFYNRPKNVKHHDFNNAKNSLDKCLRDSIISSGRIIVYNIGRSSQAPQAERDFYCRGASLVSPQEGESDVATSFNSNTYSTLERHLKQFYNHDVSLMRMPVIVMSDAEDYQISNVFPTVYTRNWCVESIDSYIRLVAMLFLIEMSPCGHSIRISESLGTKAQIYSCVEAILACRSPLLRSFSAGQKISIVEEGIDPGTLSIIIKTINGSSRELFKMETAQRIVKMLNSIESNAEEDKNINFNFEVQSTVEVVMQLLNKVTPTVGDHPFLDDLDVTMATVKSSLADGRPIGSLPYIGMRPLEPVRRVFKTST